jgi:hypothetical protein
MAFENSGPSVASGGVVGPDGQFSDPGLNDGWFDGHTPDGIYESLKGMMLNPYELDGIESTSEHGASRANSPAGGTPPSSQIDVNTPLTMGGGSFAK